jgi:DMSO/TMAO reductase YedYZ molybdopterin-dependent catalytic subunit
MPSPTRTLMLLALSLALLVLVACVPAVAPAPPLVANSPVAPTASPTAQPTTTPDTVTAANPCYLAPIVVPTPAPDPGYAELDPSTGLHVTGEMQLIDLESYRLRVSGRVEHPLELTYDQIRCLPKITASPTLTCPGFFVDNATWGGTPIAEVLALAGMQDGATTVHFVSADGYKTSLPVVAALDRSNFLAYEWNGQPLPRLHGFPLREVLPNDAGGQWNKWIVEITVE